MIIRDAYAVNIETSLPVCVFIHLGPHIHGLSKFIPSGRHRSVFPILVQCIIHNRNYIIDCVVPIDLYHATDKASLNKINTRS